MPDFPYQADAGKAACLLISDSVFGSRLLTKLKGDPEQNPEMGSHNHSRNLIHRSSVSIINLSAKREHEKNQPNIYYRQKTFCQNLTMDSCEAYSVKCCKYICTNFILSMRGKKTNVLIGYYYKSCISDWKKFHLHIKDNM